jgi:hypothetical protein
VGGYRLLPKTAVGQIHWGLTDPPDASLPDTDLLDANHCNADRLGIAPHNVSLGDATGHSAVHGFAGLAGAGLYIAEGIPSEVYIPAKATIIDNSVILSVWEVNPLVHVMGSFVVAGCSAKPRIGRSQC